MLGLYGDGQTVGEIERKILRRLPWKRLDLLLGYFLALPRQLFCWVKRKWMRIRWTTFLANTHGLKKRRGTRTWQNVSWLLPNPKYLKNHTRHISNPNTCLDSPTPNCSCSRLMKWIVYKKMGSEWRGLIKENDWCRAVSQAAPEEVPISVPCRAGERATVALLIEPLLLLPCRTIKTPFYLTLLYHV